MITGKRYTSVRSAFQPGEIHAAFHAAHTGLGEAESARLNARLALMLAGEIGDVALVVQTIARARAGLAAAAAQGDTGTVATYQAAGRTNQAAE